MAYAEKTLQAVKELADYHRISIFDAVLLYCSNHDIDVEDLCDYLDRPALDIIRQSALENNMVRQCVGVPESALQFE